MNIEEDFKMDNLSVRRFCEQDLSSIMFNLSQEDEDFLSNFPKCEQGKALSGSSPEGMVYSFVMSSRIACTLLDNSGNVLSVACASDSGSIGTGFLWSFSSSRLDPDPLRENPALIYELLRCSVDITEFMHTLFPALFKTVLRSSVRTNRAALFCGFELYHYCEYFNYYRRAA